MFRKPFYKRYVKLRTNIQNKDKIFKFKREKWEKLQEMLGVRVKRKRKADWHDFFKRRLRWVPKFPVYDFSRVWLKRFGNKYTSHSKIYYQCLQISHILRIYYGKIPKKSFKILVREVAKKKKKNIKEFFIQTLESRLDTILYRAKFVDTVRKATQIIGHGKIFVNNKLVTSKAYKVTPGDIITTNLLEEPHLGGFLHSKWKRGFIKKWPIPPKHLHINYATMEIIVLSFEKTNFTREFHSLHINHRANIAINNYLHYIFFNSSVD